MSKYGNLVREIRTKEGLSRYRLSKMSGVPQSTIQNWEEQGKEPISQRFVEVLKALGYKITVEKDE